MLIACPHCLTLNRVPAERTGQDPTCGQCKQTLLPGEPVELTDANFARITSKTELPILIDFWAPWCNPCQTMAPHFAQAALRLKGQLLLAKVDTDANPQTANRFAIRSIPTMLLMHNGQEVKRQAGAMQTGQIVGWVGGL